MDSFLLQGIKGCIATGTAAIATGLFGKYTNFYPSHDSHFNFGSLEDLLTPHFKALQRIAHYYPDILKLYNRVYKHTVSVCEKYDTLARNPRNTRIIIDIQRQLFDDLDDLRLHLSESLALEDIFNITDNIKQVITDICLSLDQ